MTAVDPEGRSLGYDPARDDPSRFEDLADIGPGACPHGQPWDAPCFKCSDPQPGGGTSRRREPDEPVVRKVRLTALSTIRPRPVRWTWQDRVPVGEVTLTPGRGGLGKSTFHAWAISHLTLGTLPGVWHGAPKACIIAAAEDSYERTIVPRLIAAGADLALVYRADVVVDDSDAAFSLSLPADGGALETEIVRTGAALLSLDPLMSAIHGGIDTHKDREVRTALEPLSQMADRTGCAILGNAHFNKSASTDPMSLIMGSAAFGNVVRSALGFARDPDAEDGSCVISQVKNNLGRLDLPSLRYVIVEAIVETDDGDAYVGRLAMKGESERSVADILAANGTARDDGDSDAESVLAEILADGPLWVKVAQDRMAEAGFTVKQARTAKEKVARSVKVGKPGDAESGWQWELRRSPEDAPKVPKAPSSPEGASWAPSDDSPPSDDTEAMF